MQRSLRNGPPVARLPGKDRRLLDKFSIVPAVACVYAIIVFPIMISTCNMNDMECLSSAGPVSKAFWPFLFLVALALIVPNRARLKLPTHVLCLVACLALAGASVTWAFRPELSSIRYLQQIMVVTAIVLPALMADRRVDLMRVLFVCFAIATTINCFYLLGPPRVFAKVAITGYTGYFQGKNYMGGFAAVAFLLSVHELLHPGRRRVFGAVISALALVLLALSNSKTALGLVVIAPALAAAAVVARKTMRLSPAIIPVAIVAVYIIAATFIGLNVYRISSILYGDSTFTGRRLIWEFAQFEIARRPLLGWGYQSFWLVGPDAPSVVEAPAWVKSMPNAHNGYLDATLEMGYVGLALLVAFLLATLHAAGRLVDRDPARAMGRSFACLLHSLPATDSKVCGCVPSNSCGSYSCFWLRRLVGLVNRNTSAAQRASFRAQSERHEARIASASRRSVRWLMRGCFSGVRSRTVDDPSRLLTGGACAQAINGFRLGSY